MSSASPAVTQRTNENSSARISVVKQVSSDEVVKMLGPQGLVRMGGLINAWRARNAKLPQKDKIAFVDWVADRDELDRLNKRVDEEVTNLQAQVQVLQGQLEVQSNALKSFAGKLVGDVAQKQGGLAERIALLEKARDELVETDEEVTEALKEPKSQKEFDGIRETLYKFNKANNRRQKEGKQVLKWGESELYSTISSEESLVAWLKTVHASTCGLSVDTINDFKVCVFRGQLVTLSKDYEGGIGIEAFWMPDTKYDTGCKQSTSYKSAEHRKNDPRHGYQLDGVKWTPKPRKVSKKKTTKKRKLTDV